MHFAIDLFNEDPMGIMKGSYGFEYLSGWLRNFLAALFQGEVGVGIAIALAGSVIIVVRIMVSKAGGREMAKGQLMNMFALVLILSSLVTIFTALLRIAGGII